MTNQNNPSPINKFRHSDNFYNKLFIAVVTLGFVIVVVGASFILYKVFSIEDPLIFGGVALLVTTVLHPFRQILISKIEKFFSQSTTNFQTPLQDFAIELTELLSPTEISERIAFHLNEALLPDEIFIFLYDNETENYRAVASKQMSKATEVEFPRGCALAKSLIEQESLQLEILQIPTVLNSDKARIQLIDCNIFVALPGQNFTELNGWIALKKNIDRQPLTNTQIAFLQTISRQSAIAIERSIGVNNLEHSIQEMAVLNRISIGINITLELDDILELLYYQTTQIIPADDFAIQLYDENLDSVQNIFIIEDNQRVESKEKQLIPSRNSPVKRIILTGNTMQTHQFSTDYLINNAGEIFEWIGTPLKSSDDIIGVLSVGMRNPNDQYTSNQRQLLESIAGLAAGAIVKARLIDETNQRALQFSALNEVSQQLNATFDLAPLLNMIVERAETMLECEAGSLLLFDDERKNLDFRVVTGPVASKLLGTSLEPGTGIAWQTVNEKRSIINNANLEKAAWNRSIDENTGFSTRNMLTTPLISQGEAIGVIEIINKRSGLPFNDTDAEIIESFAGQAAIAIENARLYTQTDEALSARVEELSIMQNIDRELNTTLDVEKAMQITLDQAVLRSHADAAFIGTFLELEESIQVIACAGYEENAQQFETNQLFEIHQYPQIAHILETLVAESILIQTNKEAVLMAAKRQTVIPILRDKSPIGILVLESYSDQALSEDMLNFLTRLVDHASISIYNADLYGQVQDANVAKSEFVSFVSHELKNPMTSIKGYTDLLLTGAVGEITDPQENFLNTIRSNVSRMDMLVSDLSDVSRIEAGRLRLDFSEIKLTDILDEVIRSQTTMLETKNQKVILDIPESLPPVWADRFRMVQILANLISNANKYSPANTNVLFKAETAQNTWDPNGAPTVVHISVKDNGMGIPEEDQKKIFTKFFRTEGAKISDSPGTGLGLNITKNLVEMQGGLIWFDSISDEGTTFHITLPVTAQ